MISHLILASGLCEINKICRDHLLYVRILYVSGSHVRTYAERPGSERPGSERPGSDQVPTSLKQRKAKPRDPVAFEQTKTAIVKESQLTVDHT